MRGFHLFAAVLFAWGVGAGAATAAMAPDSFPLGQSGKSGAVCQAQRDDDDAGAQARGARAWAVRCRGWDEPLGHLYAYSWRGGQAVGPKGIWTSSLAAHATCDAPAAATLGGLKATRRGCKAFNAKVAYAAYSGVRGGLGVAAEGFSNLSDVLETGLKVVAGVQKPPKATQTLAAAADQSAAGGEGLAQATEAATASPENLRERGYSRNLAWRFADAETDFAALAQNESAPAGVRAEAYLNWALNTSNIGRFDRADALFAQAATFVGSDANLKGELLSYRALHLRNMKQFKESIAAATEARAAFASLQPAAVGEEDQPRIVADPSGALVIGPQLAAALRSRAAFATAVVDAAARVKVQIAQTYLTQATAESALGDATASRQSLARAHAILAEPALSAVAGWLRVEVESELARQDQEAGHFTEARTRLALALAQVRQRQAGTPAEAYLVMELARAEALAGDQAAALRDFGQAVSLFKAARGSLGASADSADTYFSLLLTRIEQDPAHAGDYEDSYLATAESLGSEATADTIARLSARLNQSDSASAGLIRALEDTRRQVRLKEGEIAGLQARNAYTPQAKEAEEADLKALSSQAQDLEQKVAAADPRYGQLVSTDVSLKALQAKLSPGEMYLKVVLLNQGGYAMAIGPDWVKAYRVPLSKDEAEAQVTNLRKPFETVGRLPAYDVAGSYKLFQALFDPVKDKAVHAQHIIYEPDPSILSLPIAALATDQASADLIASRRAAIRAQGQGVLSYDGVQWLGKTARMSLAVSAASFVQARGLPASPAKQPFLGFGASLQPKPGDPQAFASVANRSGGKPGQIEEQVCSATRTALFDLKPLEEARKELASVGASLGAPDSAEVTGEAFSDGAIARRNDLAQYRVLYFATHGLLPQPGGCLPEPALLTSVDDRVPGSDGLLSASKILGLKLDADLVVLSACDTGGSGLKNGADYSGLGGAGEALGGLTRAFIYAGARSLIVSHWQIDSQATVKLMTSMFDAKAPNLGAAMQDASVSLMASKDQYSHPYYWAAFTIVGDGARPMPLR